MSYWEDLSKRSKNYLKKHFTLENFLKIVKVTGFATLILLQGILIYYGLKPIFPTKDYTSLSQRIYLVCILDLLVAFIEMLFWFDYISFKRKKEKGY